MNLSDTAFRILLLKPEEKADLASFWARPDEEFFTAGACHMLAGAFLQMYPSAGYHALMIQPAAGFRGAHVVVTNGRDVFDARGWHELKKFLQLYAEACEAIFPGWSYTLAKIEDPLSWEFCRQYRHRHASQYFRDPLPRAQTLLRKYPLPDQGNEIS